MRRNEFVKCVEGCQKQVRRFLTALCCGDSMRADDIAQDAFMKAYLNCESVREDDKLVRWIYRIAYNTFINSQRSQKSNVMLEEAVHVESDSRSDASFKYEELYSALDKLSEKGRMAILLFYMEGYDIREIAEITDSTTDAVKQQLKRGREQLRYILK